MDVYGRENNKIVKMKNLLYSLISIALFTNCIASAKVMSECADTIKIEGFFVVKYIQREVESSLKNETLRKENKTYEHFIDFDKESFFLQVSDTNINLVEAIKNRNPFSQEDIYFLPFSQKTQNYLNKFCSESNLRVDLFDFSEKDKDRFYKMEGDDKYLYKIYNIVGNDIIIVLENNELNKIKLDLADEINKNAKTFNAHFVYKIDHLQCNKEIIGFKIWEYK